MKKIKFLTAFPSVAFLCIGAVILSCTPSNNEPPCLAVVIPDTLRFNILDKETKIDLFFADGASFDTTDLQLFKKGSNGELEPAEKNTANGKDNYFYSVVYPPDTLFLKIAELPLDTLVFTGKTARTPCPQIILDKVKINGEPFEEDAHARIIPLYRSNIHNNL